MRADQCVPHFHDDDEECTHGRFEAGAGNGLGRATARRLLLAGDTVIGLDVSAAGLASLEAEFQSSMMGIVCNVADPVSVAEAAAKVRTRSGGVPCLDCIINFAGLIRGGPLVEIEDKQMQLILNVNVFGTFLINKYFYPLLKTDRAGGYVPRIVNTASEVAYAGLCAGFNGPYSATKMAVYKLSEALRQELGLMRRPVAVLTLCPGAFDTDMVVAASSDFYDAAVKQTPFAHALRQGGKSAAAYIALSKAPAWQLADRLFNEVHARKPASNLILCNVSPIMVMLQFVPAALLDAQTRWMLGN